MVSVIIPGLKNKTNVREITQRETIQLNDNSIYDEGVLFILSEHCILVIEDQEDLAELHEEALKNAGYKVRATLTGEEGLAEFRANGADCILLDMTLPEMNGAQVLREIREINPSVPVIIVTGETHESLREQCERLGVQAYLPKPVNYDAMLEIVKDALDEAPEEAELVTLLLPQSVLGQLSEIDSNLVRAITRLIEEKRKS